MGVITTKRSHPSFLAIRYKRERWIKNSAISMMSNLENSKKNTTSATQLRLLTKVISAKLKSKSYSSITPSTKWNQRVTHIMQCTLGAINMLNNNNLCSIKSTNRRMTHTTPKTFSKNPLTWGCARLRACNLNYLYRPRSTSKLIWKNCCAHGR